MTSCVHSRRKAVLRLHSPAAVRRSGIIAGLALLLGLSACATLRVGSDFDRSANFTGCRTFAWMPPRTSPYESPNPLVVQRAHDAIQAALTAKGYQLIDDPAMSDFVVGFAIGSRERTDVRWAHKELTRADIEHSAGSIREAVGSVLAQFPPK